MANVTLYTWYPVAGILRTIFRDSDNPAYISFYDSSASGGPSSQPSPDSTLSRICAGTTMYEYHAQVNAPYTNYVSTPNAPYCGYVPPSCDIALVTFVVTDETATGANDGSINMFVTSSFTGIIYYLIGPVGTINNTTGYFPNLEPGDYTITAYDSNGCNVERKATVKAYSEDYTHFKYRLHFTSVETPNIVPINWELRLMDMRNNYSRELYPVDIKGTEDPVIIKINNPDEDKVKAIISKQLEINLIYNGKDIYPDEFTLAPEQSWYVELYNNGEIEFKGWILPDETQNLYKDLPYPISLTATDGLPSLKGNIFGDGSGGNGYSTSQIQQYGITGWGLLVKQCLDQLGYDYGITTVLSSLRYNATYDNSLWLKIGTWSDILYDSSGNATDTYSALELLLSGLKLSIFQQKGSFVFINWNDLSYITSGVNADEYARAFYRINEEFTICVGSNVYVPKVQNVGYMQPNIPINPVQSLNYDKAYNIKSNIQFNILALLYENPSFEIGAVEGQLPQGFEMFIGEAGTTFELHNVGTEAYEGDWIFTAVWLSDGTAAPSSDYVRLIPAITIDQPNKLLNISFQFKAYNVNLVEGDTDTTSSRPIMGVVFRDSTSNNLYGFFNGNSTWVLLGTPAPTLSDFQYVTDFIAWNQFSLATTVFPETGIGLLNIYIFAPDANLPAHNPGIAAAGQHIRVDFDQLELTLSDGNDKYSLQTGETHTVTAVTGIPQANIKEIDLSLFTFPGNKRIAGNVMYGSTYVTGQVQNLWNFALKKNDPQDRLPATIVKAIGRNYKRPMYIFEGDIETSYLDFFGVFILSGYEQTIFMPFSIELHCRLAMAHLIMIETDDTDQQAIYNYIPVYQSNARRVVSQ